MMRVLLVLFALAACAAADEKKEARPWQDDPACRMVFFAVLEGLYTDGASDELVRRVVPDGAGVKHSFVFACPLCHPVYEAFRLYKSRQPFARGDGKRKSFGRGVDPKLAAGLASADLHVRLQALDKLLQIWITRRLELMRLSDAELADWQRRLSEKSDQGRAFLQRYLQQQQQHPEYKGWSLYTGCAACNATTKASQKLGHQRRQEKK